MVSTILVVDDNTYIVDGLVAILKKKGYNTITAHSGDEALRRLETLSPDLILLDISMEPMNGWETLAKIRENFVSPRIPVIIFSARKGLEEEMKDKTFKVDAVIAKPINTRLLLDAIEGLLEKNMAEPGDQFNGREILIKLGFESHIHDS
ncbi:MAG: hypothetical protein APR55_03075 [Methanolinea sp. SDB]|nr:MAG: hypothetical protein APR55_03075 [Methanolinea sp. SDB]